MSWVEDSSAVLLREWWTASTWWVKMCELSGKRLRMRQMQVRLGRVGEGPLRKVLLMSMLLTWMTCQYAVSLYWHLSPLPGPSLSPSPLSPLSPLSLNPYHFLLSLVLLTPPLPLPSPLASLGRSCCV